MDTLASASTTDLASVSGKFVSITGTTTINSFGTGANDLEKTLVFAASLSLTYNATSMILPGASSIVTSPGDTATFVGDGSGNWLCTAYQPNISANSTPQSWTPTFAGFTNTPTSVDAWAQANYGLGHVEISFPQAQGNQTYFTFTIPWNARDTKFIAAGRIQRNGQISTDGMIRINAGSNIVDVFPTFSTGTAWGATDMKGISIEFDLFLQQ